MIWWEAILRIFLAMVLGSIIGIQREYQQNSAGLRTHALVAIGACVAMITNEYLFIQYSSQSSMDVARMGSYVISGIGFLGAGSIIKDGNRIRGLTTAAGLWVVACLGVAIGAGFYTIVIAGTILCFFVIYILKLVENKLFMRKNTAKIDLELSHDLEEISKVLSCISTIGFRIIDIKIVDVNEKTKSVIIYTSKASTHSIIRLTEQLTTDHIKILKISQD